MFRSQTSDPAGLWRLFVLRVGAVVALAGTFFFAYNFMADADQIQEAAIKRARAHFLDTQLVLRWASSYGGVYVELRPGEQRPSGPHPDKLTADGRTQHLLHPDGVLSEIARMAKEEGGHRFHLVGRQTRDPLNAPDTWESLALDRLIGGRDEIFEPVSDDGHTLFRYMAPVLTEKSCLRCHSNEGLKIGDVQGGISISFDISDLVVANRSHQITSGVLILAVFLFIFMATHGFSRRLDRQLGNINRRYEELLQSTESIVWEANPETLELTFVSDQVQRLLGYTPDECLRQIFWSRCIAPQDISRVWEACKTHRVTDRPLHIDYRMHDSTGKVRWMQDVVVYADRGDGSFVLRGVMLDITERKVADDRVQEMLAEQSAILQNALVGIALVRHGHLVSCNHRFEQIFGAERFSLTGKQVALLYPSEDVFHTTVAAVRMAFEAGQSFTQEILLNRRDGTLFWGAMTGQLLDVTNADKGSIWIYADISERKAAQAALKQHQANLEQLVELRTADLRQALESARAADRAKDEFLANVSHEMRTPLNAVIGLSGLADKHTVDPQVHGYLGKVIGAGKTLLQIINDLLDLSKIAAGHLELEAIPFRLAEVAERMQQLMSHRTEEKGLRLELVVDPELPALLVGDPLRIEQIVLNLLTNAVKFTERGSVIMRFKRHAADAGKIGLTIVAEDSGKGMTPLEIERLFQPFSQANTTIARTHGGSGLGLAICSRFARMMGGDIQVESTPGVGSVFTVHLMLGEADAQAVTPADALRAVVCDRPVEHIRYRDTRVLVVDDQPINRQIVSELLHEVGIACDEAEDGRIAVAAVRAHPADHYALIFMDVQMPEMDGHSATRALREDPALAQLPIIAMTAFAMAHERQTCLDAGMNDHVGKPFEPDHFYRLLAQWITPERQTLAAPPPKPATPAVAALPTPASAPSADLVIADVDTQAGIGRFAGNLDAYRRWLLNFITEGDAPFETFSRELASGQRETALKTLHAFKGRCGMLGMTVLWQAVVDLESALKAGQDAAELITAARARLTVTLANIRAVIGNN